MNKCLIIVGTVCTFLWGSITVMTFGISESWCATIDRITGSLFTREIFQMKNGFYYDVSNNDMPTIIFLFFFLIIFTLVAVMIFKVEKQKSQKYSLGLIVFFSILFRLVILPGELIHENDIYRYIWDGKSISHGINPFKYAPKDVRVYENLLIDDLGGFSDEIDSVQVNFSSQDFDDLDVLLNVRDQNVTFHDRIGHDEVPTIYPPVTQILFTIPILINADSIVLMKAFFVLFDIGSLFVIISLLRYFKKNVCMSIIYGWSPLVLFEIANRGHYDSIPIFFTLFGLLLYFKQKNFRGIAVLALATLSKFFSGVLVPIIMRPLKLSYLLLFGVLILVFYIPFVFWDQIGMSGLFEGFLTYNQKWSYNASIFAVVYIILEKVSSNLTETLIPAKIVVGSLYLIILAGLTLKRSKNELDILHRCMWAIALLFIINPVADPWYFCWTIPFLCFFPYRSWYLLSGLLMLSYLNFHSDIGIVDVQFLSIPLIGWLIYLPFYAYLIAECVRRPKYLSYVP